MDSEELAEDFREFSSEVMGRPAEVARDPDGFRGRTEGLLDAARGRGEG